MAETVYIAVTWTAGDTITEAKFDNMVANDRAVDAMMNGIEFIERASPSTPAANKIHLYVKDKSGIRIIFAKDISCRQIGCPGEENGMENNNIEVLFACKILKICLSCSLYWKLDISNIMAGI